MKAIELTKGYKALMDDEDYERVSAYKWHASVSYRGKTVYGMRKITKGIGKQTSQMLHRFILRITDPKVEVDHKDHNGLNNQRYNLRVATSTQNQHNVSIRKDNPSGFKGVTWKTDVAKWRARITVNGKEIHIGYFNCLLEAACAYDMAAVKHFGKFAHCNFADPS